MLPAPSRHGKEPGQVPQHPDASPSPPNSPGKAVKQVQKEMGIYRVGAMQRWLEMVVLRMLLVAVLLSCLMTSVPGVTSSLFCCDALVEYQSSVSLSSSFKRNALTPHTRSVTSVAMGTAVTLCPRRDPAWSPERGLWPPEVWTRSNRVPFRSSQTC